jgi:hypothetical protein
LEIWEGVVKAHLALDSVLTFERRLTEQFDPSKKHVVEQRGAQKVKTYSYQFSKAYHEALNGMVERRMRAAIRMVGDFWYTCWVDAGQPDLNGLIYQRADSIQDQGFWKRWFPLRNHESGEVIKQ